MNPARRTELLAGLPVRRALITTFVLTLAFRLWLSVVTPITADEAYFIQWGRQPDWGYYDHPPMIGWWLALILPWSEAPWALRLPSTLLPAALAWLLHGSLRNTFATSSARADLAALVLLVLPLQVWNVLITTDTPFVLFAVASVLTFARAANYAAPRWFLLAGMLLGLAFLSKYLAVLIAAGYVVWAIGDRGEARWRGIGWTFAGALPAGLLNLAWNLESCWCNLLFNAVVRHDAIGPSWINPALYAASLAYLAAPLLGHALRERHALGSQIGGAPARVLLAAWLIPFSVLAVVSLVTRIGLHWLMAFAPLLLASLAIIGPARRLRSAALFLIAFAVLHASAAIFVRALPWTYWKETPYHDRFMLLAHPLPLLRELERLAPGYRPAADAYSLAAVLAYHARRPVPVFGTGSPRARQDDLRTDWRALEGANLAILRRTPPSLADWAPYFEHLEIKRIIWREASMYVALGTGFRYAAYRDGVLRVIGERYYAVPSWVPMRACPFCERTFGSARCAGR